MRVDGFGFGTMAVATGGAVPMRAPAPGRLPIGTGPVGMPPVRTGADSRRIGDAGDNWPGDVVNLLFDALGELRTFTPPAAAAAAAMVISSSNAKAFGKLGGRSDPVGGILRHELLNQARQPGGHE